MSTSSQLFNFGSTAPNMGMNQWGTHPSLQSGMSGLSGSGLQMPGIPTSQQSPNLGLTGNATTNPQSGTDQYKAAPTYDPKLTNQFFNWLQSNIGKGATPFDWSSILPSSGAATQPGQLSAPNNQVIQMLLSMFGAGGPMGQMTQTGMPTDVGPAWEAMKAAEQRNIDQGAARLREQFNVGGGLVGSPYGSAAGDYYNQAILGQNAQLTQAQQAAQEAARGRMLSADQLQQQLGQYVQGLDQGAIDRLYQEFIRTSPEYSPLLPFMQSAAQFKPDYLHIKDLMDQVGQGVGMFTSLFKKK